MSAPMPSDERQVADAVRLQRLKKATAVDGINLARKRLIALDPDHAALEHLQAALALIAGTEKP